MNAASMNAIAFCMTRNTIDTRTAIHGLTFRESRFEQGARTSAAGRTLSPARAGGQCPPYVSRGVGMTIAQI